MRAFGRNRLCRLALAAAVALPFLGAATAAAKVVVFAAASTATALTEIARRFEAAGHGRTAISFASSSTLARQILNGAPADIYVSANAAWMEALARDGVIDAASRRDLLGNRLVLIAPRASRLEIEIAPAFALAERLDGGRLAIGDPAHVPAGIYAKAALVRLGVWRGLARRVVLTGDVRAALALVERGEAAAGIVYATDVRVSRGVRVVAVFPAASHPPIIYPLAIVAGRGRPEVRRFHRFLRSAEAAVVFAGHGFTVIAAGN